MKKKVHDARATWPLQTHSMCAPPTLLQSLDLPLRVVDTWSNPPGLCRLYETEKPGRSLEMRLCVWCVVCVCVCMCACVCMCVRMCACVCRYHANTWITIACAQTYKQPGNEAMISIIRCMFSFLNNSAIL